jgi:PAS domain S-box-containing protein
MLPKQRQVPSLSRAEWMAVTFFGVSTLLIWLFGEQLATIFFYDTRTGIIDPLLYDKSMLLTLSLVTILLGVGTYTALVHYKLSQKKDTGISQEVITDIMLSREQFRQLYENSPVPYFLMDDTGNIRHPNIATLRFFAATIDDVGRANFYNLIVDSEKAQQTLSVLKAKVARALSITNEEMAVHTVNGEGERKALVSIYSLSRSSPIPFKHLVTLVDVTKERESEQIKTDFLLLASHQLRTPLTTVKWYIDYLLTTKTLEVPREVRDYLEQIYVGNERMIELITTLLTVSRIEMGTVSPEYVTVHVDEVIADILAELKSEIQKKGLIIKNESTGDDAVVTDQTMIRIALHNLLTNAIKYTPNGGTITIQADYEQYMCTMSVADTGYGIPPSEQNKIFTKMYRASNVRRVSANGTGLGLFLTKSFIEKLGGTVTFTSEMEVGTTFTISMPRIAPDA